MSPKPPTVSVTVYYDGRRRTAFPLDRWDVEALLEQAREDAGTKGLDVDVNFLAGYARGLLGQAITQRQLTHREGPPR